jgi:hypothetical protein
VIIIIIFTFIAHGPWTSLLFVRARAVVCVRVCACLWESVCVRRTHVLYPDIGIAGDVCLCVCVLFAVIVPLKILLKDLKKEG